MNIDQLTTKLMDRTPLTRLEASLFIIQKAGQNYEQLPDLFKDRKLFILIHSVLGSDPSFEFREHAAQLLSSYWQLITPEQAYKNFLAVPKQQNLLHVKKGDPRINNPKIDLKTSRFNQLTVVLRALQILADKPTFYKNVEVFFEQLKDSGFVENLDQSKLTQLEYREFIINNYVLEKVNLKATSIPAGFLKMCITAIRRAAILKAISTKDFSIVGNEDLLSKLDFNILKKQLSSNKMYGIFSSVIAVLKRLKNHKKSAEVLKFLKKLDQFYIDSSKDT